MPLEAPVTSAEVNGKVEAMREGYGDETPTMGGVRMTSQTIALLTPLALLVACGDGVDERYDRADAAPAAPAATTTTVAPEPPAPLEVEPLATTFVDSRADFSGVRSVVQLADGSWLLSGFDNHSDRSQPEPGAVWRSDDLSEWQRVGEGISDGDNQQVIDTLIEVGDTVIAADAVIWRSDDLGLTFEREVLREDAAIDGAAVIDGVAFVWGFEFDDEMLAHGQIWRSDDTGVSWTDLSPGASPGQGAAEEPVGPIVELLAWDDSLVAVGMRTDTDPDGGDYLLDEIALGSATEAWEPVDIGIWYSDDLGASWRTATPSGLTAVDGAQAASSALVVGDQLVIAGGAAEVGSDSSDDGEFGFDDDQFVATAWVCDYALQRCTPTTLDDSPHDGLGSTMLEVAGNVLVGYAMYDFDDGGEEDVVVVLDPVTGLSATTTLSKVRQVGALVVRDSTLYLFGRTTSTDELTAGTADLPS